MGDCKRKSSVAMLFCLILLFASIGVNVINSLTPALNVPSFYQIHESIEPWTSDHWFEDRRVLSSKKKDKKDPSGLSQCRGNSLKQSKEDKAAGKPREKVPKLIFEDGIMKMSGYQVRLYINPYLAESRTNEDKNWPIRGDKYYWNTETSVYYKRTGSDGKSGAGLVIGCRSSHNGHAKPVINYKNTHTYYARLRHDGKVDFVKEMTHPKSEYIWKSTNHTQGKLFKPHKKLFPAGQWYGMKFIVYNLDLNTVKLELYWDKKSHGDEDKIGNINNWEKLDELIDDGKTFKAPVYSNYTEHTNNGWAPITEGGGTVFIRNTNIKEASYKYFSVRELKWPVQKIN